MAPTDVRVRLLKTRGPIPASSSMPGSTGTIRFGAGDPVARMTLDPVRGVLPARKSADTLQKSVRPQRLEAPRLAQLERFELEDGTIRF